MNRTETDAWLLEYVGEREMVCGWDWDADLAWARLTGNRDAAEIIALAILPGRLLAFQLAAYHHPLWRKVYRGRMRAMRRLVNDGRMFSYWSGMPSSITDGASRTKVFVLGDSDHARTMRKLMNLQAR